MALRPTDAAPRLLPVSKPSAPPAPATAPTQHRALDMFDYSRLKPSKLDLKLKDALESGLDLDLATEPKTEEEALEAIDAILIGNPVNEDPDGAGNGQGTVNTDPADVNHANDTNASLRHLRAQQQVEANAALEEEALEALTPTQRAQYDAVKAQQEEANDPVAVLALQKLLFEGKLPGEEDLQNGGTLLQNLATLASPTTELADGVDRAALISDVVQEVAVPSAIAQHTKGTCAATSVVIDLVRENPAEFVRVVTGLASPDGEVELANGEVITREEGTLGDDGTGRSASQRLIQPAFMEHANGEDLDYRNGEDAHYDADGKRVHNGLYSHQVEHLLEGVFDRAHTTLNASDDASREEIWEEINEQLDAGRDVETGMRWGNGGHEVLITGTHTDPSGQEYVTYINPWGKEETLTKEEFLERVWSINYDSAPTPADFSELLSAIGGKPQREPEEDFADVLGRVRLQNIAA